MVSTHDPKKTFNLDICGGYPSLVMKMLVYSEPGLISLLPCKPQQWRSGHINGVALRGGIIVQELSWNEKEVKVTLLSKRDQSGKSRVRGGEVRGIGVGADAPATFSFSYE